MEKVAESRAEQSIMGAHPLGAVARITYEFVHMLVGPLQQRGRLLNKVQYKPLESAVSAKRLVRGF